MPLQLQAPVIEEFELTDIDKEFGCDGEPTVVMIRQATQYENEKRYAVFNRLVRTYADVGDGIIQETQNVPITELIRIEVYLTLAACNILDVDGKPLFKFKEDRIGMNETAFYRAWGKLHPRMAKAIHDHVIEVNFDWSGIQEELEEAGEDVSDPLGAEVGPEI